MTKYHMKNILCLIYKLSGVEKRCPRFKFVYRFIIFLSCFGLLLYILLYIYVEMIPFRLRRLKKVELLNDKNYGFLIKTPGCRIPYMAPFDYTVKHFIFKETHPICNENLPALIDSNSTSIFIVNSSISTYIYQSNSTLKCCYQPFARKEPENSQYDNQIGYSKYCVPFNQSARIYAEFILVKCYNTSNLIYQDLFSFVPVKVKKKMKAEKIVAEEKLLNVLIIGLDGVSRLNFYRQMPKSVEYLKNLSAVELLAYNKVADNTFPNLIPVLTGMSEDELKKNCWKSEDDRFDECPFIWKDYKKNGFTTAFGEDASWMGIFNYIRKGFKKQPTDYMWGPFNRISEELIGNSHNMNIKQCVGAREVYKVFLNYIWNFVDKMHGEKVNYFGFYWGVSLTHDYLNKPNLGDNDYYNLFKRINESQYLNNTVMIVMSDHGIRWGDIRQTFQGQMEERLPFLFMVLPEWYKRQYQDAYNNLKKNAQRLTTPFDLHETLKDLVNPLQLNADYLNNRYTNNISRGRSLFTEISKKRTCEDAGISSHWCACQKSIEISRNNTNVVKGALFAVKFINGQLQYNAQCANLKLNNITSARIMGHYGDIIFRRYRFNDYMIVFETVPGNALFEITVRRLLFPKSALVQHETELMKIMGTISRINVYGGQSACITNFHLKLYCFCRNLL